MITVVITNHSEDASRIEGFLFQEASDSGELYLSGELDMPLVDLPRNVAHWEAISDFRVIDIRDLAEPDELGNDERFFPGEDMDGDFDSAMASAGFGTDEDYGYFGGDGGDE